MVFVYVRALLLEQSVTFKLLFKTKHVKGYKIRKNPQIIVVIDVNKGIRVLHVLLGHVNNLKLEVISPNVLSFMFVILTDVHEYQINENIKVH